MQLPYRTFLMGFCLLALSCSSSDEPVSFAHYFKKVRTVPLSDEVFIERISVLDVNKDGELLITDPGNGVYIFSKNGQLMRTLSPEPCHPGFQWRPQEAYFTGDGHIFVVNGGPWGFVFEEDGTCWEQAHEDFLPPRKIAFTPKGQMYGWYTRPGADSSRIKVISGTGKTLESYAIPASDYNNLDGRLSSGNRGMFYHENHLYLSLPTRPAVQVFDTNGTRIDQIKNTPPLYQPVVSDIPSRFSGGQEFVSKLGRAIENKTWIQGLYLLNDDALLLQYVTGWYDSWAVDVLDMQGNRIIKRPIKLAPEYKVRLVKREKVYRVVQPAPTADGKVPNPQIEVYRFTP